MEVKKITVVLTFLLSLTPQCFSQGNYILIDDPSPFFTRVDLKEAILTSYPNQGMNHYLLDLDQNGITDMDFKAYYLISGSSGTRLGLSLSTADQCELYIRKGNGYTIGPKHDTSFYSIDFIPVIMDALDTLYGDSCHYKNASITSHETHPTGSYHYYLDEWISGVHFIGIKKTFGSKVYHGWVKIEVLEASRFKSHTVVFKEYGIQTLPLVIDKEGWSQALIYPNPVTAQLNIKNMACSKIEIYNAIGALVFSLENKDSSSLFTIDIGNLASGLYTLKVFEQDKSGYGITKIIKQ